MQTPDRTIVKRVKEYDPALYFTWNYRNQWFELWRRNDDGKRVLITPIVQSIYNPKYGRHFCELDERVLWWLGECDTWKTGGGKHAILKEDSRWKEWQKTIDRKHISDFRDRAKDAWHSINNFHATRYQSKNGLPGFNNHKNANKWVRPDVTAATSSRLMSRSRANALLYNYRSK